MSKKLEPTILTSEQQVTLRASMVRARNMAAAVSAISAAAKDASKLFKEFTLAAEILDEEQQGAIVPMAYCVMAIDDKTGKIKGVDVFSEPNPKLGCPSVVYLEIDGDSYGDARARAIRWLDENPATQWLRDLDLLAVRR